MPDISKCDKKTCPLRKGCYRFTSKANPYWQAYGDFKFKTVDGKVECDYFWPNKKDGESIKKVV